jgi:cleavage and polyadenylation specificity factor subunit 3
MFGEESVPKIFQGDRIYVSVDNKRANINLSELKVTIFLSSFSEPFILH